MSVFVFYCGWVIQEFLFVFHFFKAPSLSAHLHFPIFILLFFLAFFFFIQNYIKPGRGAFDLVYGMTEINTEVMSKISCVCVSQNRVLSLSTTPSTPCLSVCFLILTVTNSRLPTFSLFAKGKYASIIKYVSLQLIVSNMSLQSLYKIRMIRLPVFSHFQERENTQCFQ